MTRGRPVEPGAESGEGGASARALRLLAEVAHDIRSPLTSILFLVESMRDGQSGPITPTQRRHLGLVYTATFELNTLVNDLTELAHGSGLSLLHREPICFPLADLLASVRDLVQPVAEERRLALRIEQRAADPRMGHPAAIARVLLNLVTNALRATSAGEVVLGVVEREAGVVELSVRDTGPGIAPEAIATLFEPFTARGGRGSPRRGVSSAGLGLTICRRLVREMGGELAVESAPGVGTRFHFTIPLPRAGEDCGTPAWHARTRDDA